MHEKVKVSNILRCDTGIIYYYSRLENCFNYVYTEECGIKVSRLNAQNEEL